MVVRAVVVYGILQIPLVGVIMRRQSVLVALLLISLSLSTMGCATTKEAVGEYVVQAVQENLHTRLDAELASRHLTIAEITAAIPHDQTGKVDTAAIAQTTKDALLLEAQKYVETKIAANDQAITQLASQGQSTTKLEIINYLLGLVAAYLIKWSIFRTKDGKENAARDARLQIVEKLLNRDIDGDGKVGGTEAVESQVVS